ncbi:unnamed protein product [Adineta steineri]|uniref:Uncharacterized protein n=1 Tax=Adineta steineri TaxID=433720 RepID=A0A819K5Z1_9BILA|nr:unnamed protein product [Adineta steineri]CAF3944278.1 unnamed protein product [Adineta steineri]
MVDLQLNITTGSGYPIVSPSSIISLDTELDCMRIPWIKVSAGDYIFYSPIQEVKAQNVGDTQANITLSAKWPKRYQGLKPLWVKAEISKTHFGTGETTGKYSQLSQVISARGIRSDQCGHIIACSLGGKMIDINLFPQDGPLNCGWEGNYFIWRGVEACIKLWVTTIPEKYRPRVQFQMLLSYTNKAYPDRPEKFKYALRFLMDRESNKSEHDDREEISVAQELYNIAAISLQCTSKTVLELKHKVKAVINKVSPKYKKSIQDFLDELSGIISEIGEPVPKILLKLVPKIPIAPPPTFRNRPRSFWNFVPIVGSVKNIVEGIQDISDGYSTSGAMNLVMGGIGITFDMFTVGTISIIINSVGSTVVKEVGKEVAKEAGKTIAKEAWKTIAKEAGKEVVKEAGMATAKQVASTVAMQQGGKVAATYGVSQVARVLLRA